MTFQQANGIDGYTRLVGLIGWPAGPWASLVIYNTAFDALGLNWRYVPLPVPGGQLRQALHGLRAMGFAGAEVSEPHQRDVLCYLDEFSPAAKITGVVNWVQVDEHGRLVGDNTRWMGFLATLRKMVSSLDGLRPLIIGAGEAARSVVYALARQGLPLTIVDEQMDQAIDLVHHLRHALDEHNFSVYRWPHDLEQIAPNANLIINTWSDDGSSPCLDGLSFLPGALALDLTSWSNQTRFLRQARADGVKTASGLPLVVYEAILTFEKWTGHTPPIEVMWRAAEEALLGKTSRDIRFDIRPHLAGELVKPTEMVQRVGSTCPEANCQVQAERSGQVQLPAPKLALR